MKIAITTDATDADALAGFAAITGWTEKSGMTQEEWLKDRVSLWVMQQARIGSAQNATEAVRGTYFQAVQVARQAATTKIPKPSVELAADSPLVGGGLRVQ